MTLSSTSVIKRVLALAGIGAAAAAIAAPPMKTIPVEMVAKNIFVGQVQPSGKLHVKGFADDTGEPASTTWPLKVTYRGLTSKDPVSAQPLFANFKTSDSNQGTAHYATEGKPSKAYSVIAIGSELPISDFKFSNGNEGRPLAPGESDEIALEKKRGASNENDCTSVPAYLNEAVVLFTFAVTDTATTVRLSSYDNPGCMGYLETIYVMDVLEDGRFEKRFDLHQAKGPL